MVEGGRPGSHSWIRVLVPLAVYFALVLPIVSRLGVSWDEEIDLAIARSYARGPGGWLAGSPDDPSQARLPMALAALAWAVVPGADLLVARLVSVALGALAILGVYAHALRRWDERRALLAAGLLATSPYFLSFSRVAFTESDLALACVFAWYPAAASRLRERPTAARAAAAGALLGLAISSKFTAVVVVPALWIDLAWSARGDRSPVPAAADLRPWAAATLVWAGLALAVPTFASPDTYAGGLRAGHVALTAAGWISAQVAAARARDAAVSRSAAALFAAGIAALTALLIPPEHLANPDIFRGLFTRVKYEMGIAPERTAETAAFHALTTLLLSTPGVGAGLWAGLVAAAFRLRDPELRGPWILIVVYVAFLLSLPLAQTYYMIPLLPLLSLLAADAFFRAWDRHRRLATACAAAAAGLLLFDVARAYPDLHLSAYPWVGRRVLFGRPTLGYRSLVYTPSDGLEQALRWLDGRAGPRDRVLVYADERHVVKARSGSYAVENGRDVPLDSRPDYVLIHVNSEASVVDRPLLEREYEKSYSMTRAFGIEMASVWRRK